MLHIRYYNFDAKRDNFFALKKTIERIRTRLHPVENRSVSQSLSRAWCRAAKSSRETAFRRHVRYTHPGFLGDVKPIATTAALESRSTSNHAPDHHASSRNSKRHVRARMISTTVSNFAKAARRLGPERQQAVLSAPRVGSTNGRR